MMKGLQSLKYLVPMILVTYAPLPSGTTGGVTCALQQAWSGIGSYGYS